MGYKNNLAKWNWFLGLFGTCPVDFPANKCPLLRVPFWGWFGRRQVQIPHSPVCGCLDFNVSCYRFLIHIRGRGIS